MHDDSEEGTKDTNFWEARPVAMEKEWSDAECDIAVRIRRPRQKDVNSATINCPIHAYDSFADGKKVGLEPGKQQYYLKFDAGLHVARRRVEAAHAALEEDEDEDELCEKQINHILKKDFQTGSGFRSLLGNTTLGSASHTTADGVESLTTSLDAMAITAPQPPTPPSPLTLPHIDIFGSVNGHISAAVTKRVSDEARFKKYLEVTRLGIVAIIGFAGSGKTQLLALTARLYMGHPDIGKLVCSAPTHVATNNFANRLHRICQDIAKETSSRSPLVVRGYAVRTEVAAFIKIAAGNSKGAEEDIVDPYKTGRWSLNLSPCEWLLKVVASPGFSLSATDADCLHTLHHHIQDSRKFEGLRQFVAGNTSFSEIESNTKEANTETPFEMVRGLLEDIIMLADAVCATPFGLSQAPYAKFNRTEAKGVVLDEAGAMLQADALLVWGRGCRPCIMAGDPRQLPPTVMTHGETRNGKVVNMFSEFAKLSQLEHVMRMGWPCFVLNVQFRIVAGSFDVARSIIYSDVEDFKYAAKAAVSANPVAAKVETWVKSAYHAPASPADKILPLFFDCVGSKCLQDEEAKSRYNPQQNAAAVRLVEGLLRANLGLKGSDVIIITPYRANFDRLQTAFSQHPLPVCRDVVINTTDSFQGREGMVVVFVLGVTEETGPLFVADHHRICVGITRQIGALFVVGDINTLRPRGKNEPTNPRNNTMNALLGYFRDTKRIVHVDALGNRTNPPARPGGVGGVGGSGGVGGPGGVGGGTARPREGRGRGARPGGGGGKGKVSASGQGSGGHARGGGRGQSIGQNRGH